MIRFVYRVAMLVFAVLLSTGTASAVTSSSPAVTVPQLAKAPAVNGVIDASWNGAARVNLNYDYIYHRMCQLPLSANASPSVTAHP